MTYRMLIAAAAVLILTGLLIWQEQRFTLVAACTESGGMWDGSQSRCRTVPVRIILEKNLKRS
ncbi:MAG TPA: hypothetical protein VMX97_10515 [Hyphomicrobiaceae bacterium]|nr:hypothetical protein [Hyphomicrobiaceae bacterium]